MHPNSEVGVRYNSQFWGSRGLNRADREEEKDRELDKGSGESGGEEKS